MTVRGIGGRLGQRTPARKLQQAYCKSGDVPFISQSVADALRVYLSRIWPKISRRGSRRNLVWYIRTITGFTIGVALRDRFPVVSAESMRIIFNIINNITCLCLYRGKHEGKIRQRQRERRLIMSRGVLSPP